MKLILPCFLKRIQKSLDIRLEVYGENHPDIVTRYNNLGLAWSDSGDSNKAITYLEKAINIGLTVYGEEHPQVKLVKEYLEEERSEQMNKLVNVQKT
ncbi:MAG: tetratricopeptide repeat protein [Magnetococcales bacterium]|nr:tetratricopeptide repeat protein [Nitrospirota bacterium]